VLEAAETVFAERGFHEASMVEIANSAGITVAVIYDHFPSKADLQVELLDRQDSQLLARVRTAIVSAPESSLARLRAGVDAFFEFVEHHPYAWRMLFRDPPSDPAVASAYRTLSSRATQAIADLLRAAAPAALLAPSEAEQRAEMLAEMIKTAQNGLASWWFDHREVPREVIVNHVLEFCWLGLERMAAGERIGGARLRPLPTVKRGHPGHS